MTVDRILMTVHRNYGMIQKCFVEFRCGRTSSTDGERSGRSIDVTTL